MIGLLGRSGDQRRVFDSMSRNDLGLKSFRSLYKQIEDRSARKLDGVSQWELNDSQKSNNDLHEQLQPGKKEEQLIVSNEQQKDLLRKIQSKVHRIKQNFNRSIQP